MASSKQKIIAWFYKQSFPEGELRFDDLLILAGGQALGKDAISAAQYAAANATRHWNDLCNQSRHDIERGLRPLFRITDMLGRKAVWYPRLSTSPLPHKQKRAIALSITRPHALRCIDLLTDRQYEALGCVISRLAGADRVKLTPPGNEGGIDFFARLRVAGSSHLFSGSYTPIRVVGQCKKYAGRVTVDKVRDFITTLDSVRYQAATLMEKDLIPAWFSSSYGPMIGWIISHSGWQSGAQTLANNHGIVLSSSLDLAEVVAQSRKFHPDLPPTERASQLIGEVNTVLEEP